MLGRGLRFAALAVGFSVPAWADDAVVIVARVAPGTCVSSGDLEDSLQRSGITVGRPGKGDDRNGDRLVEVELDGTPDALVVRLRGGGRDATEALQPATCGTAADLAAAFVVSAMAPAPVPDVVRRVDAPSLERAVRDTLARRGIQLAWESLTLSVHGDASGEWFARIARKDAPACQRTLALGNFDTLSPDRENIVTDSIAGALAEMRTCPVSDERTLRRARLLADAMAPVHRKASFEPWLAALTIAEGAIALTFLGFSHPPNVQLGFDSAMNAVATTSASVLVAGGAASLVVDEDFRAPVHQMTQLAALGGFWTLFALEPEADVPTYAPVALAAGSFATAGLVLANLAMHRPTRRRVLENFARMRTHRQRASLSKTDVDRAEDDLRGLDRPMPNWVVHAPIIVSGVVAMVPSIADGFESGDRRLIALGGALYVLFGTFSALPDSPFEGYRRCLHEAGLEDVALGPGPPGSAGVSLSGRF